jgi:hypothetical protein
MTDHEKMLLEALERARPYVRPTHAGDIQADADLRAIDLALAAIPREQEAKPIAWRYEISHSSIVENGETIWINWKGHLSDSRPRSGRDTRNIIPLYAAPVRGRCRAGRDAVDASSRKMHDAGRYLCSCSDG